MRGFGSRLISSAKWTLAGAALLCLLLLVTDTRVLVWEKRVRPGDHYVVPEYGDLASERDASLVGYYFNGRGLVTRVYRYAPNNILGRDACPFILRD